MTENTVTTIVTKSPIVVMRERLEARTGELKSVLVDIKPERFIRAVISAAQNNPEIQACSWTSLWLACMRACRDDLLPDGIQGAIVPYRDKATWIPMYRGLIARAERTGKIKSIAADIVREGENWVHWIDETGVHFRHDPRYDFDAPMRLVFASATMRNGGVYLSVLSMAEADKIKRMSKAAREDSPWKMWPEEMYKKTALRRLAKLLPVDITVDEDEAYEPPTTEAKPLPPSRRMGAIAALDAFAGQTEDLAPGELAALATGQDDSPSAANADPESPEQLLKRQAYVRGKADKSAGITRKAVPTEYRDDHKLALAWALGWSGEQFPARSSDEQGNA